MELELGMFTGKCHVMIRVQQHARVITAGTTHEHLVNLYTASELMARDVLRLCVALRNGGIIERGISCCHYTGLDVSVTVGLVWGVMGVGYGRGRYNA